MTGATNVTKRKPLSRERIVLAGLDLAEDGGLEAASLHKIADRLGFKTMSLYRHVADKDDLLDAMGDAVLAGMSVPDLEGLDWGSWKADFADEDDAETPDRDSGRLLTLRKLLDAVRDCGRPVRVAIETKHPTRYAGLVERKLAQLLAEYGWDAQHPQYPSPVRVMSFSSMALQRMRQLVPSLPLVLLIEDRVPLRMRDGSLPKGVGTAGLDIALLHRYPELVQRFQQRGNQVHVWTVDRTADVDLCVSLGVDAIITNRPHHVLDLLGRGA